ncbi:serine hydrolase [Aquimarina macrocephali]|uniref:serine hydrolase n=1 Tax=Aquimarina macrocephali TaxID=666563 RepID=UPI0004645A7A|nr:serine hydrolase [Aquimarina macrocephali]
MNLFRSNFFALLSIVVVSILFFTACVTDRKSDTPKTKEKATLNQLLEEKINLYYPSDGAGAVVLIRKGGRTLLKKAFGNINIEHKVEAQTDMKFRIASITKQFTAVCILMLEEQGKLSLDNDIREYIPEYKQSHDNKITIRQLLGHTAGIPEYTEVEPSYDHHGTDRVTMDTIVNVINTVSLDFKPGTAWKYSNSGYVLLGKIVENVSKQEFRTYVQEHIFDVLDMKQSSFYDFYEIVPQLSKGYEVAEEEPHKIVHAKAVKPGTLADGGIISTIDDITIWYDALKNNTLISEKQKQNAFTSQSLHDDRKTKYGLGWWTTTLGKYTTVEHGGNVHGTECYSLWVFEEDLQIIVLSNLNRSSPGALTVQLASDVLGILPNLEQVKLFDESVLNKFTGTYTHEDGTIRNITLENGQLNSQRDQGRKFVIVPISEHKFIFESDPDWWIDFTINENKKIESLAVGSRTALVSNGKRNR